MTPATVQAFVAQHHAPDDTLYLLLDLSAESLRLASISQAMVQVASRLEERVLERQSETQLQNLWKLREYISETISHWTPNQTISKSG